MIAFTDVDHVIETIAKMRKAEGLSMRELGRRSGVTEGAISILESGKGAPKLDTVIKLFAAFGYSLSIVG